jgi:hypothetical protein
MSKEQLSGYSLLLFKLDEFIRKYYKNKMIRGAIYGLALLVGSYLCVALLEYFGRFNVLVRTFLFWAFVASACFVIARFFILPASKLFRLGKTLTHAQAAHIIGQHFPDVSDRLLNTLQLKERSALEKDNSLLEASINQRIQSLKPIPFSSAIDFRENKKYLKYALPPVALFLVLLFAAPSILTKPTNRLIKHGDILAEEAPFQIEVTNASLSAPENSDLTVNVKLSGQEIPEKIYLELNGQRFLLEQSTAIDFSYTFKNLQEDLRFNFFASGFYSDPYAIEVIAAPKLVSFDVALQYPAYLKRANEKLDNTGDLTVPEGTKITWDFSTKNAETVAVRYADSTYVLSGSNNAFLFSQTAKTSLSYSLQPKNKQINSSDSISYRIQVIPDMTPLIAVDEERDSASFQRVYFTGDVKDDYGFKRLTFNYQLTETSDPSKEKSLRTVELTVTKDFVADQFFYEWDLGTLNILPGEKFSYYFEVWDNDGVHGSKSARSLVREYAIPTETELEEQLDEKSDDIKDKLEESIKDAQKLQKEMEELRRQMMDKQKMNWQDEKKLQELLKQQQDLQKQIDQIQKQNQQKNQQQQEFNKPNEELLEKQKQLEQLMEQVISPELQKMMEELQKMMEELNKDELQEQLEKMDMSNEDLEKELDRALEQFKQLEVEQKLEKAIDKLKDLSEKQEKLAEESDKKESNSDELKKQQEELNKEFDALKKEMDEIEKLNEELENPNELPKTEEQEEQIQQDQKEGKESLEKNKKSAASKSQKSAAKKMKELAQQMESAMASNEQEQQQEDMEALRALLENIITLSFDQEQLMASFKTVDTKDPNYNKLGQTQRKLKDDARMVEDSLFALSKRVPQISAAVNHEINLVNENMTKALGEIPERRTAQVAEAQQYVMTSFNNLALMLDEALKQMQNQASCEKPGQGNCEKPGSGGKKPKPSAGEMKKMQDALSKQLEEMKKKGENKGKSGQGGKEGETGQDGQMSKQLAEMAAKQSAIRKMMEEKAAEMNQDGSGDGNEMKQIAKDMEQLQKDIVNNTITEQSLRRQQDILTRLLKAENAERVREQDNKRKSNEAKDYPTSNPMKYAEYLQKKERETELLRTVPPGLSPYYKEKANAYFNKLGGSK